MADYTIELRHVVERHNIFAFPYEFYDEKKRGDFERNFIRHFYFREIGTDSIGRFIFYLEEKMNTVFPYYNKLFEAANIEYSVLDNYSLKETLTLTRENTGKRSDVSSTVGQIFEDIESTSDENRTANATHTANSTGTGSTSEKGKSTTEENTSGTSVVKTKSETEEKSSSTIDTSRDTVTRDEERTEASETLDHKYLDSPQGAVNITLAKYLTNMSYDDKDISSNVKHLTEVNMSEKVDNDGRRDTETESTETGNNASERENETITESTGTTQNAENMEGQSDEKTSGKFTGSSNREEKTTSDNNTRSETQDKHTETSELIRKGNIGVDTDSDMINKHIKLQKILTRICEMFYDECEDLFMQIM